MRARHVPTIFLLFPVALVLALLGARASEPWTGSGRLAGTVLDAEGRPFAGAKVLLFVEGNPGQGPSPVETDAKGRFKATRLAAGPWRIRVEARGHINAIGRVLVPRSGDAAPVGIRLRSLDEVSPQSSEGSLDTIEAWIEKGDSFLRDGRYAEARSEYEKAARDLPPERRQAVLDAMARTRALEGPGSEPASAPTAPEPPQGSVPEPPERAILAPEPQRTGRYRTRLTERSPLGSIEEYARRYGIDAARIRASDPAAGTRPIAEETFEVFVPDGYAPGNPHGLLVWVSPGPFGGTESPDTQRLLAEHRLIWIGANDSGNARPRWDRTALALDAVHNMKRLYSLDERRIYVAGYSGGGRVASGLAIAWSDLFRGGMFLCGCDFYRELDVPDRPGARWPAAYRPGEALKRRAREEGRFVIVTGTRDFNRSSSRAIYEALREDGFRQAALLEIPGASHYSPLAPDWLARALDALDPSSARAALGDPDAP